MSIKLASLIEHKREIISIAPDATVYEAIKVLAERSIGALMVMSEGKPVGIISERDYARKVILLDKESKKTLVKEIMSSPLITSSPSDSVHACMELMTTKRIRHMPVVDNENLVAILSMGDLVRAIIEEQKHTIQQLETFITN
ncbi:MAG: CBS domain-containing protein [bacterium]